MPSGLDCGTGLPGHVEEGGQAQDSSNAASKRFASGEGPPRKRSRSGRPEKDEAPAAAAAAARPLEVPATTSKAAALAKAGAFVIVAGSAPGASAIDVCNPNSEFSQEHAGSSFPIELICTVVFILGI